ncbi:MAG: glycoside hydrolase family 2 [Phycisphaerae bacterium]|jgi:hypothetical protein
MPRFLPSEIHSGRAAAGIPRPRSILPVAACVLLAVTSGAADGPATLRTSWADSVRDDNVLPDYPRPTMVRPEWLNLNGVWEWAERGANQRQPAPSTMPGRILVPFPIESALSGVQKSVERCWYRRQFDVPAEWEGKRVLLHFGAVDWEAQVWVNGREIGTHRGGYDAFSFDITDALRDSGSQELLVGVYDPTDAGTQPRGKQVRKPEGIWYTPSTGIWQTVWLEPVPAAHIERLEIVSELNPAVVRVKAATAAAGLRVEAIVSSGGKEIARQGGTAADGLAIKIPEPRVWRPDEPFLYDLEVSLSDAGGVIDRVTSYVGLRRVSLGKDGQGRTCILLNGEPLFQVGTLDQGFWPDGLYTAPTDEALRSDIEITKRLGFNLIRKHVKVEPERWYTWCDRLGLLVWQDMPSGDRYIGPRDADIERTPASAEQFTTELERLIRGRGNHPSIIAWVVFNEGWGQFKTAEMVERVRKLDPTRLVNATSGWTDRGAGDVLDVHTYPAPRAPQPDARRAAVIGEFGGLGLPVADHRWSDKHWGYQAAADFKDLTRRYEWLLRSAWQQHRDTGLSAIVYTQITDVETECNGLLTYDRAVLKVDEQRVRRANRGEFEPLTVLVPTSRESVQTWRYSTEAPATNWSEPGFDDACWKKGDGGFGTSGTPGATVGTVWDGREIWLRRRFELSGPPAGAVYLLMHHDEDAQVFINGVLAATLDGYTMDYEPVLLAPEARDALRVGNNLLAVHCRQTTGGQYIDVGLIALPEGE